MLNSFDLFGWNLKKEGDDVFGITPQRSPLILFFLLYQFYELLQLQVSPTGAAQLSVLSPMDPSSNRGRKLGRGHRWTIRNSYPLTLTGQLGKHTTITKVKNKRRRKKKNRKKHFVLEGLAI